MFHLRKNFKQKMMLIVFIIIIINYYLIHIHNIYNILMWFI